MSIMHAVVQAPSRSAVPHHPRQQYCLYSTLRHLAHSASEFMNALILQVQGGGNRPQPKASETTACIVILWLVCKRCIVTYFSLAETHFE
jgi:hypothetical protein